MTRTRARAPRSLVTLATVALALCTAGPLGFAVTQRDADGSARRVQVTGLAEVFTETWALEDRNGDSQADFIAARIVVPETPAPEELAAATAIAARLGLETSGLTLPLVFRPGDPEPADGPRIVVGTDNPELDPAMATRARALAAGQGLVAMSGTTVVVAGGDDAGTQAAAEAFAARSPYLWAVIGRQNGDTFDRVAQDIAGLLTDARVPVSGVTFDELVYETDRREAVSVQVTVDIDSTLLTRAREALDDLVGRHRRGLDTDRLSYASVASLELALGPDDPAPTVVPRVGLPLALLNPPRPPATRFQTVRPTGPNVTPEAARTFDLSEIFVTDTGLLRDRDLDEIPDDADMMIVVPGDPAARLSSATVDLGARLGLESTGLTFPLLGFDHELEDPEIERRPLVLIGADNEIVRELDRLGKIRGDTLPSGSGRVEMVPDALNESSAVVVTGGDGPGETAAVQFLASHAPYLWETGRGATTLGDARRAARKLIDGRTTAGQASLMTAEIDDLIDELGELELASVAVDVYLEDVSESFAEWLASELSERLELDTDSVTVVTHRRHDPVEVFVEEPALEWEVETFRTRFRQALDAHVGRGSAVTVELRVSESPEMRADLATEIRRGVTDRGGTAGRVIVLSAFKQGLSWLTDDVAPRLAGRNVTAIEIAWRPFDVDISGQERFYNEPARWLNELYPADELLAAELALPIDAFTFVARPDLAAAYEITAADAAGAVVLHDTFTPAVYERPYLEAFPDVATSTVTTGWLTLTVDGVRVVDERVPTDLDRIWDHYQSSTLTQVLEHVNSTTGDTPTADKAPYFHTLRIDLEASEPDFRLGLDEEQVSALESLHDSFYFDTLDFFYEMAQAAAERDEIAPRSLAAGNVLPWVAPERRGQAPALRITYSGFASKEPKIVVTYRDADGDEETETRTIEPIDLPDPYLYLAEIDAGVEALAELGFLVTLSDDEDEGADGTLRRVTALLEGLTRLQGDGLFPDAFGLPSVDRVSVRIEAPNVARTRTYDAQAPVTAAEPPAPHPGGRLVTWDHVISPDESERLAHTLGTLPNVTTYVAGESYQGRPVSVMEIRLPMDASLVSQAKLSTWKPVLSIMGRQHANEVSSTSHILRLAELLATDPEYERYLHDMNIVIQPVVNPDGAALAYELQQLTPYHCLHAGRYSALGPDVPAQADDPDTLLTEALVLSRINDTWIPDIRLNPHGYPSHEWVQHFANYNPKSFRSYWIPRGWWTNVRVPEHPALADARDVAIELRDRIAEEVSRDPEVRETNLRIYDRYRRWAVRWQPHVYNLEVHDDTAIYSSRRTGAVARPGTGPQTTIFEGMTEAMDETAQGPWLDLVTRMGFGFLRASAEFLSDADYELYRLEEERGGRVHLAVTRPRPVRPGRLTTTTRP